MLNPKCSLLQKIPRWLPSILCVVAILWLTLASDPTPDMDLGLFPGIDKLYHAIMFGGLTLCLWFDTWHQRRWHRVMWWLVLLLGIASALFGVGIEYLQGAMGNGRSFEPADMLADAVGAIVVALTLIFATNHYHRISG